MNLLEKCQRITNIEHQVAAEYQTGTMKTPIHLCLGQEAICVAVCEGLSPDDLLFAYYRSHGWYLAKGGSETELLDELRGKKSGCSRGQGGSMHLIGRDFGFHGTTAIVGAQLPHSVGAALSLKMQGKDHLVICAFGDGATEQGVFMESLMFAALHSLRILFVCINDGLATTVPIWERQPVGSISTRAESFGVKSKIIEAYQNDPNAIIDDVEFIKQKTRTLGTPHLIQFQTLRTCSHVGPGYERN